jgi:hypothetical protein
VVTESTILLGDLTIIKVKMTDMLIDITQNMILGLKNLTNIIAEILTLGLGVIEIIQEETLIIV